MIGSQLSGFNAEDAETGDSMRRKRFQKGSVRCRKHGQDKVWVGQWWDNGHRKSKVLGKCCEMAKGQAEAMMASVLQPINETAGIPQMPVFSFKQYVEDVFLPVCRRKWKESTRMTSEPTIELYLLPAFGPKLLSEINRGQMQRFLDGKAATHSHSVVGHLRWHLSAIYKMAMSDGAVNVNPTLGLYTPACKPAPEPRVMSVEDIVRALNALDLRERLVFRMAVFDGMRPGEILALRVGNLREQSVYVDQRLYRGNLDSPKGRKGKRTARTVALSPSTVADLREWRVALPEEQPEAFLFPSERLTMPVGRDNLWRRYMLPKLESVGLEWATFQVLRRTNASLSRKAKVDDKVAADQRGHGLGVSLEVYAVSDLQQKIEAVTKLESVVIPQPKTSDPREGQTVR
jgi:integrase